MDGQRRDTQPHIFVSYRRTDKGTVLPIIRELERRGYRVWYDVEGIGPGGRISEEIERNIEQCAVFLAFLSEDYYKSDWCLDEIEYAVKRNKFVIPVKLDNNELMRGLKLRLKRSNVIQFSDKETLIELIEGTPESKPCRIFSPLEQHSTLKPKRRPRKGNLCKILFASALIIFITIVSILAAHTLSEPLELLSEQMKANRILSEQGWIVKNGVLTISKGILDDTGKMPDYQYADTVPWAEYRVEITKVVIKTGVPNIGSRAFLNYRQLKIVSFQNSVREIGRFAFYNCLSLASVTIPEGVTTIGQSAFYNCLSLTSVTIPDSVTAIGAYAFRNCYNLSTAYILGNQDSIDIANDAFAPHTTIIYGPPPEDAAT